MRRMKRVMTLVAVSACLLGILASASLASWERLRAMGNMYFLIEDEEMDLSFNPAYINRVTGEINILPRLSLASGSWGAPDDRVEWRRNSSSLGFFLSRAAFKFGLRYVPYSYKESWDTYTYDRSVQSLNFQVGRSFSKFNLGLDYLFESGKSTWDSSEYTFSSSRIGMGVLYPIKEDLEVAIGGAYQTYKSDGYSDSSWRLNGLVQYETGRFGTLRLYGWREQDRYYELGIGSKFSAFSSSLAGVGIVYQRWDDGDYRAQLRAGLETPLSDKLKLRVGTIYRLAQHNEWWDGGFSDSSGISDYTMGIGYSLSEKVQIDLVRQWLSQSSDSEGYKSSRYDFRASIRVKLT